MIIDSLQNTTRYETLNPYFKQVFDFLRETPVAQLPAGKTILQDGRLFLTVNDTRLKKSAGRPPGSAQRLHRHPITCIHREQQNRHFAGLIFLNTKD